MTSQPKSEEEDGRLPKKVPILLLDDTRASPTVNQYELSDRAVKGQGNQGEKDDEKDHELSPRAVEGQGSQGENDDEKDHEYPSPTRLGLIVLALSFAAFISGLDGSILYPVIPKLTSDFKTLQDAGWYGGAYFLLSATTQLPYGKLYNLFSVKIVFLYALLFFEIGSLLCAVAHSSPVFIMGRAMAGLGNGGILTGGLLILRYSAPLAKRPIYLGIATSMMGLSNIAGPLIGGFFTEKIGWRWCFWINIPIGFAVGLAIVICFKQPLQRNDSANLALKAKLKRLDLLGMLLIVSATTSLLLALTWGGSRYPWSSWPIILLFCASLALMVIYAVIQRILGDSGTVPQSLLRREIAACCLMGFVSGAASNVINFWLPAWFQVVKNDSPLISAVKSLPLVIGFVVCALLSGPCVTFLGYWGPILTLGSTIMTIGAGLLTRLSIASPASAWIGYQAIFGTGFGLVFQGPVSLVQEIFDDNESDVAMATALVMLLSQLGPAVALSIAQSLFVNSLSRRLVSILPGFEPRQIAQLGLLQLRDQLHTSYPTVFSTIMACYKEAIISVLFIALIFSGTCIVCSIGTGWKPRKRT